jgi:hypothetical protein
MFNFEWFPEDPDDLVPDVCVEMAVVIGAD